MYKAPEKSNEARDSRLDDLRPVRTMAVVVSSSSRSSSTSATNTTTKY